MSARTDESAPMRVFWAYADDGAPELRLGFPDGRSPELGEVVRVLEDDLEVAVEGASDGGCEAPPDECSWCGAEIDGRIYRRREELRESYCSRSHRDAAQRAVAELRKAEGSA